MQKFDSQGSVGVIGPLGGIGDNGTKGEKGDMVIDCQSVNDGKLNHYQDSAMY